VASVIGLKEVINPDSASRGMGKSVSADNDPDMVDVVAVNTEEYKVAASQVIFGHHTAEQSQFRCGAREDHPKLLFVEILHKP